MRSRPYKFGQHNLSVMARRAKAKSKKQQRIEARDEAANRRFIYITIGVTVGLLLMMYMIYNGF